MLKKSGLFLLLIVILFVLSPFPDVAKGQTGATVGINSGNQITLKPGETRAGSGTSGISVTVSNLPNMGAPANGFAAFEFTFTWDKNVIRVDSISPAGALNDWSIAAGDPNQTPGRVRVVGLTTTYSTADVILLYLGITAVGKANDTATIGISIDTMIDKDFKPIAATAVNAPVKINAAKLVSIVITPADASVPAGATKQFFATGNYNDDSSADISGTVTWTSSKPAIATIKTGTVPDPGTTTGITEGQTTINAVQGTLSASATLTITKAEQTATLPPTPSQTTPAASQTTTPPAQPSQAVQPPAAASPSENPALASNSPAAGQQPPAPPVPPKTQAPAASQFKFTLRRIAIAAGGVVVLGAAVFILLRRRVVY